MSIWTDIDAALAEAQSGDIAAWMRAAALSRKAFGPDCALATGYEANYYAALRATGVMSWEWDAIWARVQAWRGRARDTLIALCCDPEQQDIRERLGLPRELDKHRTTPRPPASWMTGMGARREPSDQPPRSPYLLAAE